jgi:hypothetical protein
MLGHQPRKSYADSFLQYGYFTQPRSNVRGSFQILLRPSIFNYTARFSNIGCKMNKDRVLDVLSYDEH